MGTGLGGASLALVNTKYQELRMQIDVNLDRVETTLRYFKKSLDSLALVVLQNWRGLDLLALEQGGICRALGEECCFYADYSGIITKNLDKIRKGIEDRRLNYDQGWFSQWFDWSPWLTTLIGPSRPAYNNIACLHHWTMPF